jgi:hypothetical protein
MAHALVGHEHAHETGINWKKTIQAGLIAGAVFMMLEMILVAMTGGSAWGPPRMIAAMVMGTGVLPPPATFDIGILMVAMMVHFVMSIAYMVTLSFVIRQMNMMMAVGVGVAFGLALYFINFYGMTAVWEWFAMARNWVSIFSHVMFGAVAAMAYKRLQA